MTSLRPRLVAYILVDAYCLSMIQTATVMSVGLISTLKHHALPTRHYTKGNTMNVYLDIDGVLLANEENLAIGAEEFTALYKYAL